MNTLLIPKNEASKIPKDARGSDFWNSFWLNFNAPEQYLSHIENVKQTLKSAIEIDVPKDREVYVSVALSEEATSKSKRPREIWKDTNIDIVEGKDNFNFTLSGKKSDFEKLEIFLGGATFEKAKVGVGVMRKHKNMYREFYAVSFFSGRNTEIEGRLGATLLKMYEENYENDIECIVELWENLKMSEYDQFFSKLVVKIGQHKI